MTIHQNDFAHIEFFAEQSFMLYTWRLGSVYLNYDLYKAELLQLLHVVKTYRPRKILFDTTQMRFTILNDLQAWTNNEVSVHLLLYVEHIAIITGFDFAAVVSIEQTVEESDDIHARTRYFRDREAAQAWIDSL
jgi:hypothetical protein